MVNRLLSISDKAFMLSEAIGFMALAMGEDDSDYSSVMNGISHIMRLLQDDAREIKRLADGGQEP